MMSLFLHICTGLGLALAAGLRPFTPALAAGGLAGAHAVFDFAGTHYAFLASAPFLLAVALCFAACAILRAAVVAFFGHLAWGQSSRGQGRFAGLRVLR